MTDHPQVPADLGPHDRIAWHAESAHRLLEAVARHHHRMRDITPEQRLELAVSGNVAAINADVEHSVRLAHAHAVTALALQGHPVAELEEPGVAELEAAARPGVPTPPRTGVSGAISTADLGGAVKGGRRRVRDAPQA